MKLNGFFYYPGPCLDVVGVADCPTLRYDFENENVPITVKTHDDQNSTKNPFTNNGVITCLLKPLGEYCALAAKQSVDYRATTLFTICLNSAKV